MFKVLQASVTSLFAFALKTLSNRMARKRVARIGCAEGEEINTLPVAGYALNASGSVGNWRETKDASFC